MAKPMTAAGTPTAPVSIGSLARHSNAAGIPKSSPIAANQRPVRRHTPAVEANRATTAAMQLRHLNEVLAAPLQGKHTKSVAAKTTTAHGMRAASKPTSPADMADDLRVYRRT
jgi:hypothetical protein